MVSCLGLYSFNFSPSSWQSPVYSCPSHQQSKPHKFSSLSPIVVLLQIFPFSTAIFTDIALRKLRILFLIQWGVFEPLEALPIHTLSKLHYLIHELYLTNHLSFLELLDCETHCHPLLSLNPTICHLLNLTSIKLILSPFLLKIPRIFSVFPLSGLCYRPYGLSPTLLTKKKAHIYFLYVSLNLTVLQDYVF